MLRRTTAPVTLLLVLTSALSACSGNDGCAGQSYRPDRAEQGAASPIDALNAWLAAPEGFDPAQLPPDDGWIMEEADGDAGEVVLRNDTGDGWWVQAVRTDDGGYVVAEATDDWASCEGKLS